MLKSTFAKIYNSFFKNYNKFDNIRVSQNGVPLQKMSAKDIIK
jgi:hypothetical protein